MKKHAVVRADGSQGGLPCVYINHDSLVGLHGQLILRVESGIPIGLLGGATYC